GCGRADLLRPDRLRHPEDQGAVLRGLWHRDGREGRDLRRAQPLPRLREPVPVPDELHGTEPRLSQSRLKKQTPGSKGPGVLHMPLPMKCWAAFLQSDAGSAVPLLAAAVLALVLANSPAGGSVAQFLHLEIAHDSLVHWIDDGLMVVFFLLVGMEIKREVVS